MCTDKMNIEQDAKIGCTARSRQKLYIILYVYEYIILGTGVDIVIIDIGIIKIL